MSNLQAKLLEAAVAEATEAVRAKVEHKLVGNVTFIHSCSKFKAATAMAAIAKKHGLSDPSLLTFERLSLWFYETEEAVETAEVRV